MFRRAFLPLSLCVLLLTACAGAQLGSGKARFLAVETRHFVLYTDLSESDARDQANELERLLFALQETAWESTGDLPLKLNVIMFADRRDFARYNNEKVAGYAVQEELFEPWIVVSAPHFGTGYREVAHELTHGISFQAIGNMPRWMGEGLASYFESARFRYDGSFEIGAVPSDRYHALGRFGWDMPSTLLAGTYGSGQHRFYGSSWILVHYLMTKQADGFVAYQDQLARGRTGVDAWTRAFPNLPPDKLDEALVDYASTGAYAYFTFELTWPRPSPLRVRRVSLADEHMLSALLWKNCKGCSDKDRGHARWDLERALALDRNNVWAVAFSIAEHVEDRQTSRERAKRLVHAHPEHWLSWATLAMTARRPADLLPASQGAEADPGIQAMRLAPTQPYALMMAAATAALRGDRESAIAHANAARRMQPSNGKVQLVRGYLMAELSACRELHEAIDAVAENAHAQIPEAVLQPLRKRAETCKEPVDAGIPQSSPPIPETDPTD